MEKITLEMMDEVKARTGVTYEKAKEALETTGGDVIGAIILLERGEAPKTEKYTEYVEEDAPTRELNADDLPDLEEIGDKPQQTNVVRPDDQPAQEQVPMQREGTGNLPF